jgi:hypothetical protein
LFNEYLEDTKLVDRMNKMDEYITEAKKRERVDERIIPTPAQVTRGVICKVKEKEMKILRKELNQVRSFLYIFIRSIYVYNMFVLDKE